MLPGLRFLFVAIVLSLSMMIFGLGAVALLRSAHQEFVSLPTRHVQPEMVFAQQTQATTPTLAMLSVDRRALEHDGIDQPRAADAPPLAPPPQQPAPLASVEPERAATDADKPVAQTAALRSEQKSESSDKSSIAPSQERAARIEVPASPLENHEPEIQKREAQAAVNPEPTTSAAVQTIAPAVETPAASPETTATVPATIAAAPATTAAAPETIAAAPATAAAAPATIAAAPATKAAVSETTAAAPEPTATPTDDSAKPAAVKTATLGAPEAATAPPTASKNAVTALGKRAQARHPVKRRKIARARVAPPPKPAAAAQPAAPAPFFQIAQPGL